MSEKEYRKDFSDLLNGIRNERDQAWAALEEILSHEMDSVEMTLYRRICERGLGQRHQMTRCKNWTLAWHKTWGETEEPPLEETQRAKRFYDAGKADAKDSSAETPRDG